MAEALLLSVMHGVVRKAGDALVQRITRMWGIDDNHERLERRLVYVQSLLADAEVKSETNNAVRTWMKALKDTTYRADDVLDDFQYEALRLESQSRGSMTSKVIKYFTFQNRLLFRHKASGELKSVLDKIEELVDEMKRYELEPCTEVSQVPYRQTHSALDESAEIFGRDEEREQLVKVLLDQKDQRSVQVLPIIGMGGLGKTTLAKMVYNDPRVQKHFELKMWYCVSENFEATTIMRSVIELGTNERCDMRDNIEMLKGRLQEVIGRKRFLLILDDVWNEDQRKWDEDLRPLLCSSIGGCGSAIVMTSRLQQVASIMGTLPHHELKILSEEESWKLFSMKAFANRGVQEQTELVSTSKRIVNNCKGLPLALKTMGGLMSSKESVQEWEAIADCNISDTNRGKDEVMSILKLSYKHLSSEMKQCFAFCAIFPKDYKMEKDMLIQLWMANGYIREEGVLDLTDKSEYIFNELAWRSFLQDVNVKEFNRGSGIFQEMGCKMHDLMHDLALSVTDECAPPLYSSQKMVPLKKFQHARLSIDQFEEIGGLLNGTSSLRTLLIQSEHKNVNGLKLMSLRALSCAYASSIIHSKLMRTSHLRYLDLSGPDIVRLPNSICMLYNLQTLRLECSRLRYLPEGMATMRKLMHIHLWGCYSLKRMPPNLSLLCNLRTLTKFVAHNKDGCGIDELEHMRHLGNKLELLNLREAKSGSKVNLHEKNSLNELGLAWGPIAWGSNVKVSDNEEQLLESLEPPSKLKVFWLSGYNGITIPQWMRDPRKFHCISELVFYDCSKCKELPIIWLSPSLEKLTLHNIGSLNILCKNIEMEAVGYTSSLCIFPKLRIITLTHLPDLERWAENTRGEPICQVKLPQLERLTICGCPKLAELPQSPVLTHLEFSRGSTGNPMDIPLGSWPSLVHLKVGRLAKLLIPLENQQRQRPLENLRSLTVCSDHAFSTIFNSSNLQHVLRDCFPFVEVLKIEFCDSIFSWHVEELRRFPHLRTLEIFECNKLVGKGSSLEETLMLPHLERLRIEACDCLLEIPRLPPSLERMEIASCRSLVALPDTMDGLTCLEHLEIHRCPHIQEFPQGLLHHLPALKFLQIWDCPELQRHCREGGKYFNLVSSIRKKDIPFPATGSSIMKFVKKLLPSS